MHTKNASTHRHTQVTSQQYIYILGVHKLHCNSATWVSCGSITLCAYILHTVVCEREMGGFIGQLENDLEIFKKEMP